MIDDAGELHRLSEAHLPAAISDHPVAALVSALLFFRGPLAVAGLVIAVSINSINRMGATWTRADIMHKCPKVIFPFVADGYPTPAVVRPLGIIDAIATRFHCTPGIVLFGAGAVWIAISWHSSILRLTMEEGSEDGDIGFAGLYWAKPGRGKPAIVRCAITADGPYFLKSYDQLIPDTAILEYASGMTDRRNRVDVAFG